MSLCIFVFLFIAVFIAFQEHCLGDFDVVRLVRAVREREAHFVARRLRPDLGPTFQWGRHVKTLMIRRFYDIGTSNGTFTVLICDD